MFRAVLSPTVTLVMAEPHLAEAIYAEADRSRASLQVWLPWAENNSLETTQAWIKASMAQYSRGEGFQAVILDQGEVAGTVGYVYARSGRAELGYWLGDRFRGRGLMTMAVRAMAEDAHTRLKIHRVEILCVTGNRASRAVPERLGIPLEGVMRGWWNQGKADVALYARVTGDPWKA